MTILIFIIVSDPRTLGASVNPRDFWSDILPDPQGIGSSIMPDLQVFEFNM
jgi:hypothetical protein